MECGSPVPNDKGGTSWWNNHIPPKSIYTLLKMTGGFCLGPHCERCSGQQGGFIRAFRDWLSERGRSTEEIMEFVLNQAERWF